MKSKKLHYLVLCLFFSAFLLQAQSFNLPQAVVSALNDGNANDIAPYLNENVELVIRDMNNVYSKQQSTRILADFFRKNPVVSFEVIHKGKKEQASFAIGKLTTKTGVFRIYLLIRQEGIQQLRIEPSGE